MAGGLITANGGDDVAKNENISDVYVVIIFNLETQGESGFLYIYSYMYKWQTVKKKRLDSIKKNVPFM